MFRQNYIKTTMCDKTCLYTSTVQNHICSKYGSSQVDNVIQFDTNLVPCRSSWFQKECDRHSNCTLTTRSSLARYRWQWKCVNKMSASQEAAISEIVLDDDISDSVEYKLDIVSVCCYSKLSVDVLRVSAPIQTLKLLLNVCACLLICITT